MKTELEFKKFNTDKSVDELRYNTSIWSNELAFVTTELSFMRKLIKSYPFGNNIPNLFERIQLFIKEIDLFKNEKYNVLSDAIQKHEKLLEGKLECTDLSCDHFYVVAHEKLASKVFNYIQNYRHFKRGFEEYISSNLH